MSELQRFFSRCLAEEIGSYFFKENYRPDWMINDLGQRLELDFFIEDAALALEIQGVQHLEFRPFFHPTYADFVAQQRRDADKRVLCDRQGVELLAVYQKDEIVDIIDLIRKRIPLLQLKADIWSIVQAYLVKRKQQEDAMLPIHQLKRHRLIGLAIQLRQSPDPTRRRVRQRIDKLNKQLAARGLSPMTPADVLIVVDSLFSGMDTTQLRDLRKRSRGERKTRWKHSAL